MALRPKGTLTASKRSVNPGEPVTFTVKIENTGGSERVVKFEAEATNLPAPFYLDAVEGPQMLPKKSQRALTFTWKAESPEPGAAKTLRGEARIVDGETGDVIVKAPLDLYVAAPFQPPPEEKPREEALPIPEGLRVRPERPAVDGPAVAALLSESPLGAASFALRASEAFVPELALVALRDERVVGHLVFFRATVQSEHRRVPAIVAGPLLVVRGEPREGVALALLKDALDRGHGLGHDWVVAVDQSGLLPRLGFKPAEPQGIRAPAPVPGGALVARRLQLRDDPPPDGVLATPQEGARLLADPAAGI